MLNPAVPHGWHYYWKSTNLAELSDAAIDVLAEHALDVASPRSYTLLFRLGGAIADVGEDDTAAPRTTSTSTVYGSPVNRSATRNVPGPGTSSPPLSRTGPGCMSISSAKRAPTGVIHPIRGTWYVRVLSFW
ncbi:hypothetical protein [Streptomyces sp. UG1]|uniref:hypothetical protein n=1 Tax=Streptomyces sp. UG1 TaxID=3417652 RepID=UPI003CF72C73